MLTFSLTHMAVCKSHHEITQMKTKFMNTENGGNSFLPFFAETNFQQVRLNRVQATQLGHVFQI